jgi:diguanylate cyclase (GGDEF)-like protein/PAS domain S-box-containing protein
VRLNITPLQLGWSLIILGRLIDFFDEFTSEPEFFDTTVEGILIISGFLLIVRGFSQAYCTLKEENELREKVQRELITTFEASPVGMIKIDGEFRIEYMNQAMKKILGLKEGEEPVTVGTDIRTISSVMQAGLDKLFDKHFENETVSLEIPFRSLYGRECYLSVAASPIIENGGFIGAVIVASDITERKKLEQRINYLENVKNCVLNVLHTIVMEKKREKLMQKSCEILTQNRGYVFTWIGMIEENTKRVIPAAKAGFEEGYLDAVSITWDDTDTSMGPTGRAIKTKRPAVVKNVDDDPSYEPWLFEAKKRGYASSAAIPLVYEDEVFGALNVYSIHPNVFDDEEIELLQMLSKSLAYALHGLEIEEKLRKQAIRDGLTGLYNRTYFNERIQEEVERAKRYGHPLSFIMMDVDKFKEVNDRYSHLEGDEILKQAAEIIITSIREIDMAFRYGGDEFLLVLPETEKSGLEKVVRRIKNELKTFNDRRKSLGKPPLKLSFGISTWRPESGKSWEDVLKESDLRMYEDKMNKKF